MDFHVNYPLITMNAEGKIELNVCKNYGKGLLQHLTAHTLSAVLVLKDRKNVRPYAIVDPLEILHTTY